MPRDLPPLHFDLNSEEKTTGLKFTHANCLSSCVISTNQHFGGSHKFLDMHSVTHCSKLNT